MESLKGSRELRRRRLDCSIWIAIENDIALLSSALELDGGRNPAVVLLEAAAFTRLSLSFASQLRRLVMGSSGEKSDQQHQSTFVLGGCGCALSLRPRPRLATPEIDQWLATLCRKMSTTR